MVIWRTIYSDVIEIDNINNIDLKNECIDNLTD